MVAGSEGARNQERLRWQGPADIYWTGLDWTGVLPRLSCSDILSTLESDVNHRLIMSGLFLVLLIPHVSV
jgi:hypothetical protein